MLGRRQTLIIAGGILSVSLIGGWVWSSLGNQTDSLPPALTLTPGSDTQTLPTNAANAGKPLANVTLQDADGNKVSTSELHDKPLIINFWFSTCEPCRREMPVLEQAHGTWGEQINFVGVNPQDNATGAEEFAAKYGVDYKLLADKNGELVSEAGISTFPTTLFVNTNGEVVLQYAGELNMDSLQASIEEAFGLK